MLSRPPLRVEGISLEVPIEKKCGRPQSLPHTKGYRMVVKLISDAENNT